MRIRNKYTGEIATLTLSSNGEDFLIMRIGGLIIHDVKLADLKEWEDYEEPKGKHWYMTSWGEVWQYGDDPIHEEWRRILGNDFETKEEAERAVEKLKAWKRLKDAGFRFAGYDYRDRGTINDLEIYATFPRGDIMEPQQRHEDLELFFGGKE